MTTSKASFGTTIPTFTHLTDSKTDYTYVPTSVGGAKNGIYANVQVLGIADTMEVPRPMDLAHMLPAGHSVPDATHSTGLSEPANTSQFQVDTGSWATVLPKALLEKTLGHSIDWASYPQYSSGSIEYSSDGQPEAGVWVPLKLAFPDARLPDGSVPTTIVTALVTTTGHAHMLGIGFNEGFATNVVGTTLTPANNAVLNLAEMKSGQMTHSYMIDSDGIHLGWSTGREGEGWTVQQLQPEIETQPLPVGSPKDWQGPLGSVTINGVTHDGASMLFDTGTPAAFIHFPGATGQHDGRPGNHFAIAVEGQDSAISYAFVTGGGSPEEPRSISESDATHGSANFMNTGMNFFREYRYAYDADKGLIAFKSYASSGTALPAPALSLADDTGIIGDNITSDAALELTPSVIGGTLFYKVDSSSPTTSYNPKSLADGAHRVLVYESDTAGEISEATTLSFTLDRTAPAVAVSSQALTHTAVQTQVALSGTVEAVSGTTIRVMDGSTDLGAANLDGQGHWSFSANLGSGPHSLSALATDTAGNTAATAALPTFSADTATFGFKLTDAHVTQQGNAVVVDGPDGSHTLLTGVDRYTFTDGTVNQHVGSALVDDLFYYAANLDVWQAQVDATTHYNQYGWGEGRDPNALFSTKGYLAANPDVVEAGLNPLSHYDQYGWKEGRDASMGFDNELYLARYADVKAAGIDPLAHYLQYGLDEGRAAYPAIGRSGDIGGAKGFDAQYYLLSNQDVAKAALVAGGDAFAFAQRHFDQYGWQEGRNPNSVFDTKGYLSAYGDVAAANINPLTHYDQYGWKESRDPSTTFDTKAYEAAYTDVKAAEMDPMLHYLQFGAVEGRSTFSDGHFS